MYIVAFPDNWYLRSTTATGNIDRAQRFATEADAKAALAKQAKWFKPAMLKRATIITVE